MSQTIGDLVFHPRASDTAARPDLSQIPAYVEPPRPRAPRRAERTWQPIMAFAGVGFTTIALFGSYLTHRSGQPDMALPPAVAEPVMAATGPRPAITTVALPASMPLSPVLHAQYTAAPTARHFVHARRLTRPSRG